MTDEEPEVLGAEDEERVRRMLAASASGREEMPDDVAARLDEALARLVAERGGVAAAPDDTEPPARIARVAARRRRWPNLLAAAAVVSLLALGVGSLVRGSGGGQGSSASSAGQAASAPEVSTPSAVPDGAGAVQGADGPVPRLHSATLARGVRRLLGPAGEGRLDGLRAAPAPRAAAPGCAVPPRPRGGRLLAVRLDGSPATLALAPVHDGVREANVYSCDDASAPVAHASVAVP